MEYEGQICRGPMERSSYMLPVSVGCKYNACRFCMLFKHLSFREIPMGEIGTELKRVSALGAKPPRVFLGDGNAFSASAERLIDILNLIHKYLPGVAGVNMDATVMDIAAKSDEELKSLAALGVNRLYLGIESGLEDVLDFMNKGNTLVEAEEQINRLKAAGISYGAHIMTGVAGAGRGMENAAALADFLNRTSPEAVINFSMFIHRRAPLYKSIESGHFTPATELENLEEERRLIESLTIENLDYDGFHDFLEERVRGHLPTDKAKMLSKLDSLTAKYSAQDAITAVIE